MTTRTAFELAAAESRLLPHENASALSRWGILAFGLTSYAIGVAGLCYLILSSMGFVPYTGGPVAIESTGGRIAFSLALVALFGVQHAVMARSSFKAWWTKIIHPAAERSLFTLLAGALMALLCWLWQPLDSQVWLVETPALRIGLLALAGLGWTYLLAATFAIDHFELFGVKQVLRNLKGRPTASPPLTSRLMYRFDRHPIMSGVLIGLWATPDMQLHRLVLAVGLTLYVIIGVAIEEAELVRTHGDRYREYRDRVGTLVPRLWSR
jgi:protein-S-isoprenylcysteine O-methyltransferase Ste14